MIYCICSADFVTNNKDGLIQISVNNNTDRQLLALIGNTYVFVIDTTEFKKIDKITIYENKNSNKPNDRRVFSGIKSKKGFILVKGAGGFKESLTY